VVTVDTDNTTTKGNTTMAKTFGSFNIPVRARHVVKAPKFSNVVVTTFAAGQVVGKVDVVADKPRKCGPQWEPEEIRYTR
jgi:hypothetical protein